MCSRGGGISSDVEFFFRFDFLRVDLASPECFIRVNFPSIFTNSWRLMFGWGFLLFLGIFLGGFSLGGGAGFVGGSNFPEIFFVGGSLGGGAGGAGGSNFIGHSILGVFGVFGECSLLLFLLGVVKIFDFNVVLGFLFLAYFWGVETSSISLHF